MESLMQRLKKLKEQGFEENFVFEGGYLMDKAGVRYSPDDLVLAETYRIEDDSDPSNQVIVYALEERGGSAKGVVVDSFGLNSDQKLEHFIRQVA